MGHHGQKAFHNIWWYDLERFSCGGLLRKCPQGEQKSVISASHPSAGMWKVYVLDPGPYFHVAFQIEWEWLISGGTNRFRGTKQSELGVWIFPAVQESQFCSSGSLRPARRPVVYLTKDGEEAISPMSLGQSIPWENKEAPAVVGLSRLLKVTFQSYF